MLNISEGIKAGKVQTIVVPSNFTALMMNKWLNKNKNKGLDGPFLLVFGWPEIQTLV
jgi:hypothetical protein